MNTYFVTQEMWSVEEWYPTGMYYEPQRHCAPMDVFSAPYPTPPLDYPSEFSTSFSSPISCPSLDFAQQEACDIIVIQPATTSSPSSSSSGCRLSSPATTTSHYDWNVPASQPHQPPKADAKTNKASQGHEKKKRSRAAQACEKCRIRKAKCHGGQPCARCKARGLVCDFLSPKQQTSKELASRSPYKAKGKLSSPPQSSLGLELGPKLSGLGIHFGSANLVSPVAEESEWSLEQSRLWYGVNS